MINRQPFQIIGIWLACLFSQCAFAVAFTVVPSVGTSLPTSLVLGNTVKAYYTVINNTTMQLNNSFVKYLPPNTTQVLTDDKYNDVCQTKFSLAPGGSCTLVLNVSGAVNANDSTQQNHLFVCHPNIPACAGTNYPLDVKGLTATVSGTVQSGGNASTQVIPNAAVSIYAATHTSAVEIGKGTSNQAGQFFIHVPPEVAKSYPGSTFYAVASLSNAPGPILTLATPQVLMSIIGPSIDATLIINELTTVASAYAMNQFLHGQSIYGSLKGVRIAAMMFDNLVSSSTGLLSAVINSSPNADQTNSRRSLDSLANLLSDCIRNGTPRCNALFTATTFNGHVPTNTLGALANIVNYPSNNVAGIFALSSIVQPFTPFLTPTKKLLAMPDAWTIAVKFNASGNEQTCPIGGPGAIAFDDRGFVWISNNVVQGTPDSTDCMIVLKPNGMPADGVGNTPKSPIFGGGLLGGGFGISVASNQSIWYANFGWGGCPTCNPDGSVTNLSPSGIPISGPNGYQSKAPADLFRVQGVFTDKNNNLWMASFGNDKVVVFLNSDPNNAIAFQLPEKSGPFGLAIAPNGDGWITTTGSPADGVKAIVSSFRIVNNKLVQINSTEVGALLKGIAFDSAGNAWVASSGDGSIYQLNANGDVVGTFAGVGGLSGPWGLNVDKQDNIWVGNFFGDGNSNNFRISKLCGINPANCPPGSVVGSAITPATGYTLPTAGEQVLLGNGQPLNGPGAPPVFIPLMRQTYAIIDSAGNVWVTNNWKPQAPTNQQNPSGDGVVAFIGIAPPAN